MRFSTVPVETARQQSDLPPPESLRPLVLVVDDEPLITETLAAILGAKGLAVLTASNGPEALAIAELMPPELLITDVSMPAMNGFELAAAVKDIASDCEVIFFTGHLNMAEMPSRTSGEEDACVLLVKPVHPADLLDNVTELLRRRGRVFQKIGSGGKPQSLFEYLSTAVRLSEVSDPGWSLRVRHRHRIPPTVV